LNADPIQTGDGWVLEIGKEDARVSIKNCRLDAFGRPYCYVRKVAKASLEIETKLIIEEMVVSAIGTGPFLSHKYDL
jgi:hypothetical protein